MEVHERLVPEPLAELRSWFDWSELNIYDVAVLLDGMASSSAPNDGGKRAPSDDCPRRNPVTPRVSAKDRFPPRADGA